MKGFQSVRRIETAATTAATTTLRRGQRVLHDSRQALHTTVRWMGFWAAIVLPVLYLPVLAFGLSQRPSLLGLGLLGCHLFALVAGHNYTYDTT